MKQLAQIAGVSEATASLAMNNRPGVKATTRDYIQQLAKEHGYIPSQNAQSLAMKKSGLIGMIIPNISNTNYAGLVESVEILLRENGYHLVVATSRSDASYESEMIKQFIAFRVEGVILYPSVKHNEDPSYVNLLKNYNIPFVYIGGYYREVEGPVCINDYLQSMRLVVNDLLASGCRRVCLVSGDKSIVSNSLRRQGIRDILQANNLPFFAEDHISLEQPNYQNAYDVFSRMMQSSFEYDAVITVNALSALGIYNAAIENGLRVPQDLSIVAGDCYLPQKACAISLTGIRFDSDLLVHRAVDILLSQIQGIEVESKWVTVAPTLIQGDSTRHTY